MRAEFVRPRILTLVTTHQCTAACDHCCFACAPQVTDRIPQQRLSAIIDEALAIPSIRFVSFVGGECFLLGSELDTHFAHCKNNGFAVGTTTNGYWAVNAKAAASRVRTAAESGLGTIYISTGEMHARYVPHERIIHAALAASDLGLETHISIETFLGTSFDPRCITENRDIAAARADGRLDVFEHDWLPHADGKGRASLEHAPRQSRFHPDAVHEGCKIVLDDLTVTPSLQLFACCGYPIESIPALALGSLESMTLLEVLENAPDETLALWLHVAGPERMLLAVKRELPDYRLPNDAVHPCQVCLYMHRDATAMRVLRAQAPSHAAILTRSYDAVSKIRLANGDT